MGKHWPEEPSTITDISIRPSTFISGGYYIPVSQMIKLVSVELTRFNQGREESKYQDVKSGLQKQLGFIFLEIYPWGTKVSCYGPASPPLVSLQWLRSLPSSLPFPSGLLHSQALLKFLQLSDSALRDKKVTKTKFFTWRIPRFVRRNNYFISPTLNLLELL